jgi:Domain of unknown function (DUF5658)
MARLESISVATRDWTLSLHVFLYLQVLDVLTTWLGFRLGLAEASPFICLLMHWGPLAGVVASKAVALSLGAFCVWWRRYHVIHLINYWYAALVVWNLSLLMTRASVR